MESIDIKETIAAQTKVKEAIVKMRFDHKRVCDEITVAELNLSQLRTAPVPFDDLKAGILDFVQPSGLRYAEDKVKRAIRDFATGRSGGSSTPLERYDKPLAFSDIEGSADGSQAALGWAQLCSPDKSGWFNDQVFYFFCGELVKDGLHRLMESMTPEDFGYNKIPPNRIGSPRHERRAEIAKAEASISELVEKKKHLEGALKSIGVAV